MATTYSAPLESLSQEERCTRCEILPQMSFEAGWLHLGLPVAIVLRNVREVVTGAGWQFREEAGALSIAVPLNELAAYCTTLEDALTPVERESIRALFVAGDRAPRLTDLLETDSLRRVSARAQSGALVETLGGFLTSWFQPIVHATSLEIFGYEALLRATAGAPLATPMQIFDVARGADLLPHTDLAARQSAIACAATAGITDRLFINFCPSAIYDPKSCLRSTIAALDASGFPRERVVFEVVESDEVKDADYLLDILRSYRQAGFKVALDDLGAGFSSLNLLHMLQPDFIKLDIALVRNVDTDPFKAMLAAKLIEAARGLDLMVIAEGVETAAEYAWFCDNGAHLIQGFYLARPSATPAKAIRINGTPALRA